LGGLLGDQIGYTLGRFGGTKLVAKEGRLARIWRRHEPRAARLFRRHASMSVSLARFISFVRTLMPWFAGMSGMPYRKFLLYDVFSAGPWRPWPWATWPGKAGKWPRRRWAPPAR
jgi:membrane protein DedA with SNARE-associated domain